MEPQNQNQFNTVTTLSKAIAAILFIVLPFVGLYIGYTFAPEKVVEVEKVAEIEKVVERQPDDFQQTQKPGLTVEWFAAQSDSRIQYRPGIDSLGVQRLNDRYSLVTLANTMLYAVLVYDEESQRPVRIASEYNFFGLKKKISGTEYVQIVGNEIQRINVLTGEITVLYKEENPGVQLADVIEIGTTGILYVTSDDRVVFGRHKKLPGTTLTEFIETKAVPLGG